MPSAPTSSSGFVDENIGYQAFSCAIAFIVIEVSVVALRVFTRILTHTRFGWDDALIIPSLLFAVSTCGIIIGKDSLPTESRRSRV